MRGGFMLLACVLLLLRSPVTAGAVAADSDPSPVEERSDGVLVKEAYVRFVDRATLAFERPGVIADLTVREGDSVDEDEIVVTLNDAPARAALAIAVARASTDIEVRVAEKEQETADAEYQAVRRANETNAGTFPEPDVARLRLAAQRAALLVEQRLHEHEIARLTKEQTEAELATYSVRAPSAGVVTNTFKAKGEAVQAGEQVVEIVNTHRVRIDGYIDLADSWQVKPGDAVRVRITDPLKDVGLREHRGTLRFVDVSIQTVRKNVRVWAEVDDPSGVLRDGLSAEMRIIPADARDDQPSAPIPPDKVPMPEQECTETDPSN